MHSKSGEQTCTVNGKEDEAMEPSFNPVEFFESFIQSFKSQTSMEARDVSSTSTTSLKELASQRSPQISFREEQLTFAHREERVVRSIPTAQLDVPSNPTIDPIRHCSVAFFDLDDTLIPTDWVRRAFVAARNRQFHISGDDSDSEPSNGESGGLGTSESVTIYEALSPPIQAAVRRHLEQLGGQDFDERAADIVEKACLAFGVVVVVTNARSVAWLRIVSDLFPKLKAQLRRFSVPIIRAAVPGPGTSTLRTEFASVGEYFQYWTSLKRLQFSRVAAATREVLAQLQRVSTLPTAERASHFLSELLPSWLSMGTQPTDESEILAFTGPASLVSESTRHGSHQSESSYLTRLPGGELLLSPRSHGKESHDLEAILQQHETCMTAIDDSLLTRIVTHQVRRFLLHHHSVSHADIAGLPYSPRSLLTTQPPTFPATPTFSRHPLAASLDLTPLRHNQPLHAVPHLPEALRNEFVVRQAARRSPAAPTRAAQSSDFLLDIVCVGDSEFELCAARELAITNPQVFRGVGLIKCRPGLPPDQFRDQLDEIEAAMACIAIDREESATIRSSLKHLGPYVSSEFVTQGCAYRTELLGLSLTERESSRFRRHPGTSDVVKGIVTAQSHAPTTVTSHISSPLQQQRMFSSSSRSHSTRAPQIGDRLINGEWVTTRRSHKSP